MVKDVAPSWTSLFSTPISTPVHLRYDQISLLEIVDVSVPNLSELRKSVKGKTEFVCGVISSK